MGRDKALLPFRGGTLADAVVRAVEEAAGSAILVGHPGLGGIPDLYPGEGPLGGILTALEHTSADWNLITACDMPHLTPLFLRELFEAAEARACEVLLPCGEAGLPQPLCAIYHRSAGPAIRARFAEGTRKITAGLEGLVVARLELGDAVPFQNVNTPEDWAVYGAE
jgi:molybdenum cofactor guanylyltransferase